MEIGFFMSEVFTPIMVAVIGIVCIVFENGRRRAEERRDKEASRQNELMSAVMSLTLANARGTTVLLRHAHGEQLNGNVDAAIRDIDEGMKIVNNILNDIAVRS